MIRASLGFLGFVLAFVAWQAFFDDKDRDPNNLLIVEVNTSAERTGLLRSQLDRFEAENPGLKVDVISLSWGQAFEKLSMMIAGGQIPDVIEMPDFWLARFVSGGQIADMSDFVARTAFDEDLEQGALDYGKVRDKTYTVPYGYYLSALIYNKKLFAQAGIKNPPLTIDDFYQTAAKLSDIPGVSGYCHQGGRSGAIFYYWLMTTMNGSRDFFDADGNSTFYQPGAIKGLTLIRDMYQNGYAPQDSLNWGFSEIVSGFYSGSCAMLHQKPDTIADLEKRMDAGDYASAPMPLGPNGKSFPHLGYIGWSVHAQSVKKEAAFKLVDFLLRRDNHEEWAKRSALVPIYRNLARDMFAGDEAGAGWLQTTQDPRWEYMINPNYLPDIAEFDSIDVVQSSQAMLLGDKTPEETAKLWADFLTASQKRWVASND